MQKSQFEKAEPIVQKIRDLNQLKNKFDLPSECYSVEFRTLSGHTIVSDDNDLGGSGMKKLINEFKSIVDKRIETLEKDLEEI